MDFNAQVDDLQKRVSSVKESVSTASQQNHEELERRITAAHAAADQALDEAGKRASGVATEVQSSWDRMQADARAHVATLQSKARKRADQIDADVAESDAEFAEADAQAALDYAGWAIENARGAILDAIDARAYANDKAAALV
jgi:cell division septum initiation protein DivIVA